jgi:hypothetical protein
MGLVRPFEFTTDGLEFLFVEELGRRTLGSAIVLRVFLAVAWAVGWRKLPHIRLDDWHSLAKPRCETHGRSAVHVHGFSGRTA